MKLDFNSLQILSILHRPPLFQDAHLKALYHRLLLELALFQKITLSSDGKDKSLKVLQYSLKLLLLLSSNPKSALKNTTSSLSLARRVTRLGRSLPPLLRLAKNDTEHSFSWLDYICLANDVCDDILVLHLLFPKHLLTSSIWKTRVEKCSGICWAISIMADLQSGPLQHWLAGREDKIDYKATAKLVCDLLFCLLDLLDVNRPMLSSLCGWVAALLSYQKLRLKQMMK